MSKPYIITLFSRLFKTDVLTYKYPHELPLPGDLIELIEEDVYFRVENRAFKTNSKSDDLLIPITFFGEIEGHDIHTEKTKFIAVLSKIEIKLGEAKNNQIVLKTLAD